MKKDLGGVATLAGLAFWAVRERTVPCDFYWPLAENAVDAHSFRPGDILTARNGLCIEIDNTDAEGRLVLGDALSLASEKKGRHKPRALIDVSTLTGAIKVALGPEVGGLFATDKDLSAAIERAAEVTGDPLWPMPLLASERKKLKSSVGRFHQFGPRIWGGPSGPPCFSRNSQGTSPGPIWISTLGWTPPPDLLPNRGGMPRASRPWPGF